MSVLHTGETDHDKELQRWNQPKRQGGMGPDRIEPFPVMVYRAWKRPDGRVMVLDETNPRAGWAVAATAYELSELMAKGFRANVDDAFQAFEAEETALFQAAAETAYTVSKMSQSAQREYAAADAASTTHVLDVPVRRKRSDA